MLKLDKKLSIVNSKGIWPFNLLQERSRLFIIFRLKSFLVKNLIKIMGKIQCPELGLLYVVGCLKLIHLGQFEASHIINIFALVRFIPILCYKFYFLLAQIIDYLVPTCLIEE